jgi:PAS domain S-box-containing protein
MFHPDDLAAYVAKWRVAVTTGTPFESEGRLRRFDGEYRWFLVRAEPLRDERGVIVKWYGTNIDIDDRRQAEQALRRSEAYLTEAQRLSLTGTFGWATDSGELHWSEQSYRIFGYDRTVKPSIDLVLQRVHPDDVAMVGRAMDLACRGDQVSDLTHRLLMPDGSVKFVHVLSHRVNMPGGREIVGALMDVTAFRQAEQALRDNEQRLRDYAETASDWIWESGPDHRFTHVTDRLTVIDMDPVPTIGRRRWDLAACIENEPEKWCRHKATLDAHQPFRGFTYTIAHKDGSVRYVSVSGKPVFDDKGRFMGYRGVGTDVTAAIRADQAEKALRQAQTELSHVTRVTTLGGLAASIAHEVNQPLSAIVANGEAALMWLAGEAPDWHEARCSVQRIIGDAHRASAVIRRTRELSRRSKPEQQSLDVNNLIDEALLLVQREAISHQVSLRLDLASGLAAVRGDRVQLEQVIINLVINGIEAMATVIGTQRELLIRSYRHDGDQVLVAVQDRGSGIEPENAEEVFNAFFTTKPSGMGMGLSICRSIIEAHGGRLWASRNIGPGTTFQFTLRTDREMVS